MTDAEKRQQRGNTIVAIVMVVIIAIGLTIHFIF
jgi:hypothetical protein